MRCFLPLPILLSACSLFSASPPVVVQPGPARDILQESMEATVMLVAPPEATNAGRVYCAGVFIREFVVATAAHCVVADDGVLETSIYVAVYRDRLNGLQGFKYAARSTPWTTASIDEVQDVALLVPSGSLADIGPHLVAPMAADEPGRGEPVVMIGHPRGLSYSFSEGRVVAFRVMVGGDFDGQRFMQVTAPAAPGNSGGPVFNRYGEVLGLTSFGWDAHLAACVPLDSIRAALGQGA